MADEPPKTATSPGYDTGPNADTTPLEYEHPLLGHGMRSPDWAADPGYDDEANAHGLVHAIHHAVEPHFDDTEPFKHGNSTLWDELRAADGDWAAEHEGGLEPYQGIGTGVYLHPNHSPPPSPTSWYPPQPQPPPTSIRLFQTPNTSRAHTNHYHYPAPLLFPHYRTPRHRHERRPPRTRRDHYRPPRQTISDKHGERGPLPPLNITDRAWERPRSPPRHLRLPKVSIETDWRHLTSPGSWRERPPHLHPPRHTRTRSDSPDWRNAHPGRPISFKSPMPPPTASEPISEPPTTQKFISAPPITSDLNSLVKQASTALRNIITVAEKLVRRVNAERRIAHSSSVVRLESARGRAWKRVSQTTPHVSSLEGGTCDRVK
jgi:hypothetical protein